MSLVRLKQYIYCLTEHAASCGVPISFLGESSRHGLATVSVSQCSKWRVCLKYKKQRLEACYGSSVVNSPDSSYGSLPAEPDIPQNDLFQLCLECLERIQKTAKQIEEISELTAYQADDESGEWMMLCRERIAASSLVILLREGHQHLLYLWL